jgi:hypothetical protein
MARFVYDQYEYFMNQCGIFGYVLDGRCEHTMGLVARDIEARPAELKMDPSGDFLPSRVELGHARIHGTEHRLPGSS